MVRSAVVQLAKHGLQGASFAEVLAHANAPRGSVYHHFPGGKHELVTDAIAYMGTEAINILDALDGSSIDGVIDGFVAMWQAVLERSDFAAGCSIVGVTVTADSDELLDRTAEVFQRWRSRLAEILKKAGLSLPNARAFATMMIASAEGAVVLARAERNLAPLDTVSAQLHLLGRTYRSSRTRSAN
jgi:TetR/AcrR family transcriptional repressor of lmrAB and yxaGH operons